MKILFVDNEDDIVTLVEMALGIEPDIELTTATSGNRGLDLIDAGTFDAFVFDLMMPKPDGRALLARVRGSDRNGGKPVIICTGRDDSDVTRALRDAGASEILVKPFDPLRLAGVIRDAVAAC